MGHSGRGNQPLEGWAPPFGPMCLGLGGNPKGGAPPLLGGQAPSLAAAPPLDLI